LTSPTRALSPCGCGKTHNNHYTHMESLPEEQAEKSVRGSMSVAGTHQKLSKKALDSVLTLGQCCSPRAAMMSELAQPKPTRQRKVTIPILHCRAVSSSLIDHQGVTNVGNTGGGGGGASSSSGPMMSSSLHRRSLQDVDALGLFHHGRGIGRHLSRQSSDDSRRRSSANLQNAGSVTHLAGSMIGSSVEQSNLMKMRNSNLGQSAPSLTASLVRQNFIFLSHSINFLHKVYVCTLPKYKNNKVKYSVLTSGMHTILNSGFSISSAFSWSVYRGRSWRCASSSLLRHLYFISGIKEYMFVLLL